MKAIRLWLSAALALVLLAPSWCAGQGQEYVVGAGDVLRLTIYEHEDMTSHMRVEGDGTIAVPLLGQVKVAGLTVSQITEKLSAMFADGYLVNPQVNLFVEEFRSQGVIILGYVKNAGLYELRGRMTLLDLISKAGGLTEDAGDAAVIKRKPQTESGQEEKVLNVDLKGLVEQGRMDLNILLLDGDSIYINKAGVFFVSGEVNKPGAYKQGPGTTVIKAITMAGGFTEKASATSVKIIRKKDGVEQVSEKVKMNEPVQPDDVIVVPESFF